MPIYPLYLGIDVGAFGKEGDSNIFKSCPLGKDLYSETLNLSKPTILPNSSDNILHPFVFIDDEAFALHTNLLRQFPGRHLTAWINLSISIVCLKIKIYNFIIETTLKIILIIIMNNIVNML